MLETAQTSLDVFKARRFLRALCATKIGEVDPTIIFQCVDDAKKDRPGLTEHKGGTLLHLLGYLQAQNQRGAAIFFQVNAGGRGDNAVHSPRALVVDDDLKADKRPDFSKLLPSAIVRSSFDASGRPKMHYYWFLIDNEPLDAWLPAMRQLAQVHGTDPAICKLSLVMRLPGFLHCKGAPQRSELIECHPNRRFTIAEVLTAFSSNGVHKANGANGVNGVHAAVDKYAKIDAALAGELPIEKGADGKSPDEAPHTEASRVTFQRLCAWLNRIGEPFIIKASKPRFIYLTKGCPRNREHKDAIIIAATKGGIVAKCFHDSCNANKQSWKEWRDILGSWSELRRGDHVELATRLRNELRAEYKSDLIAESNHRLAPVYRYDDTTRKWLTVSDEVLCERVMTYAGLPTGEKGTAKRLNASDVQGTINLFKIRCAQPTYFMQAPVGVAVGDEWITVDENGLRREELTVEHRARWRIDAEPGALDTKPTRWLAMLRDLLADEDGAPRANDGELIAAIGETLGFTLIGRGATRDGHHLLIQGLPNSGKSTLLTVISSLVPNEAQAALTLHDLNERFRSEAFIRARLITCAELPERDLLAVEKAKAVLTGDPITVEGKGRDPITVRPIAGWVVCCNELPAAPDASRAIFRRFIVVRLRRQFAISTRDHAAEIMSERGAIIGWALRHAAAALARGHRLVPPECIAAANEWAVDSDLFTAWLAERVTRDVDARTSREDAWTDYRAWVDARGGKAASLATFRRRMAAAGFQGAAGRAGGLPLRLFPEPDALVAARFVLT